MKGAETPLNRYEQALYMTGGGAPVCRSVLAGVARSTRLARSLATEHEQVIWNTAANVIGPVLFGYVLWVLREAAATGVKRLYFVSRDGQILWHLATLVEQAFPTGIECRYLYGSRQAWFLPAVQEVDESALAWILQHTLILTVRCVCERVDLTPETIQPVLEAGGFPATTWDQDLDQEARVRLRDCFRQRAAHAAIQARTKENRELVLRYFQQEGLLEGQSFALVDIGWAGRLQRALSRLLTHADARPAGGTKGFYFGLCQELRAEADDVLRSYFIHADRPEPDWYSSRHVGVLELFMAADHHGVRGYQPTPAGRLEPQFLAQGAPPLVAWGVRTQQEACLSFVRELLHVLRQEDLESISWRAVSDSLLRQFLTQPTPAEARAYGCCEITEQQTGQFTQRLTPPVGHWGVWRHLLTGKAAACRGEWTEGAIVNAAFLRIFPYLKLMQARSVLRGVYRRR